MQLSIVVPVYGSESCLSKLASRVHKDVGENFESYELILVNDNSPDGSWNVIVGLTEKYNFITGVDLRKNVGQDNAIMAGLHHAKGDVIIIMDDDLQHDPSDINSLYQEAQKGFDVVYAQFEKKEQALWKNLGSWFNDRMAVLVLKKPRNVYMSPYKAIRREVVNEIIKYEGPYSYVDGIIFAVTSNFSQIPASHHTRFSGTGNYNLIKSVRVWLKLVTGFSVIPLRLATILGGVISIFSFLFASYFVFEALFLEQIPAGWPSLIVSIFFLGGIQLVGIGMVGEYIGRIFITQNRLPQYTIKKIIQNINDNNENVPGNDPVS
jgi:undecaprenyl-phosphate 4-deoxy-4-formamido-L-arabinose transferase